jgi:hypothetical protein
MAAATEMRSRELCGLRIEYVAWTMESSVSVDHVGKVARE